MSKSPKLIRPIDGDTLYYKYRLIYVRDRYKTYPIRAGIDTNDYRSNIDSNTDIHTTFRTMREGERTTSTCIIKSPWRDVWNWCDTGKLAYPPKWGTNMKKMRSVFVLFWE